MNTLRNFLLPAAVVGTAIAGSLFSERPVQKSFLPGFAAPDTVLYTRDAYKLNRKGDLAEIALSDSILASLQVAQETPDDTIPALTARDTIVPPDSLRDIDPFRYKYYVALLDSLTHRQVSDSLRNSIAAYREALDTLHARLDSADRFRLDSLYAADSAARARAAFIAWYNGLSKEERKKYDYEQKMNRKMAEMDSLKAIREEKQAVKDSIRENTPRILETFAVPESLYFKRIIAWELDPDFQKMNPAVPDTTFNKYFYDYAFRRADVNSTWLGVAGSPVQNYNWFRRDRYTEPDFYAPYSQWSFSHETLRHWNTKTPYTELAYWGTLLLASDETESDNLHIFTTQNITPAMNFQLLYDRWGGGGMLDNETTKNKTFALAGNYLGKKYLAHAGVITNSVSHEENGGVVSNYWIRDTTVEAREISVMMNSASSSLKKRTGFIDQQYRIPLSFLKDLGHPKDTLDASSDAADSLSIDRDVTTAFIGHSGEWSKYTRSYTDAITNTAYADQLFNSTYNYSTTASSDAFLMTHLDNKLFLKLQPWSEDAIVSKLNVGIGDRYRTWLDRIDTTTFTQNSVYAYAGAEGRVSRYFDWEAKGRFTFAGAEAGDFSLGAGARFNMYPFRKARNSPLSIGARFETSLLEPDHYQQKIYANHFSWDNSFGKVSTTKLRALVDIPYWKTNLDVGYALLANNLYYDEQAVIRQHGDAMSVVSASLRKEFVLGGLVHLDNRVLIQASSAPAVMPVPLAAVNLRWFLQFVVQTDAQRHAVMTMQVGMNGWYNSQWHAPAWNPAVGAFHNQTDALYENGPVVDLFMNIQWKRACIFLKLENANMGWPLDHADYFTAHNYIGTQRELKLGIFWPFYTQPGKAGASGRGGASGASSRGGASSGSSASGTSGRSGATGLRTSR